MSIFAPGDLFSTRRFTEEEVIKVFSTAYEFSRDDSVTTLEGLATEKILGVNIDLAGLKELDISKEEFDKGSTYIRSILLTAEGLGMAKSLGMPLAGSQREMIENYFIFSIARENYRGSFEDTYKYTRAQQAYFNLIITRFGVPSNELLIDIVSDIRPADFKLGKSCPQKQEYLQIAWPLYVKTILNGELKSTFGTLDDRLHQVFGRIHEDSQKLEQQYRSVRQLQAASIIDMPKRACRIETGMSVDDICFSDMDELVSVSSDYEHDRYVIALHSSSGKEITRYIPKTLKPAYYGHLSDITANRWKDKIAVVINGQPLIFDSELNLLEEEKDHGSSIVRTDMLAKVRDIESMMRSRKLASLSSIVIDGKDTSYMLLTYGYYSSPEQTFIIREDGKMMELSFNSSGLYPAKSRVPAIQCLPDGDLLIYTGDFFRVDKNLEKAVPFYLPMTLDAYFSGKSECSNSHYSVDSNGRLYIINQLVSMIVPEDSRHKLKQAKLNTATNPEEVYSFFHRGIEREIEPTPSLKIYQLNGNDVQFLAAMPLTCAGNIDYYASTAAARDGRFAITKFDAIEVYEPLQDRHMRLG